MRNFLLGMMMAVPAGFITGVIIIGSQGPSWAAYGVGFAVYSIILSIGIFSDT